MKKTISIILSIAAIIMSIYVITRIINILTDPID